MGQIVAHLLLLSCLISSVVCKPPHILFILADDYGYNDVGYHNPDIITPHIDKLAKNGVILENYYVQPICTPSRSQLLTGRYQIHTGLQHSVIFGCQPHCVPLDEVLLSQKLKEVGYETHIVGKWHLGFYKEECMPTKRGFDSHYGYLCGAEDYYTKQQCLNVNGHNICGYDFRDNMNVDLSANGTYSPYLYEKRMMKIIENLDLNIPLFLYMPFQSVHFPLEAPQKYLDMYKHIKNKNRRTFSAMVTAMDDAIGNIIQALNDKGIMDETLIVFSTDNGGQTLFGGNNWPLRGRKATLWEGGVHGLGFIHGAGIQDPGRVSNEFVHISDWFPTLLYVAGGNINGTKPLDGYNVWDAISTNNNCSPRKELLHNIDPLFVPPYIPAPPLKPYPNKYGVNTTKGHSALRMGKWKLLQGYPGFDQRVPLPTSDNNENKSDNFQYTNLYPSIQLYDVVADPTESHEVAKKFPSIVDKMLKRLSEYNATSVPINWPKSDPNCVFFTFESGVWGPWQ